MRNIFIFLFSLSQVLPMAACSCFGPQTFCGTLDPPYQQPEWWIPDAVVLGVKLSSTAHGMDILVLNAYAGQLHAGDTVRVWGDTGNLCRTYTGTWSIGDTVVWGLQHTDQAGGTLEQPEDYLISVCGVYSLEYTNDEVSGPITLENGNEVMSMGQFALLVTGCLSTGIEETGGMDPMVVSQGPNGTSITMATSERVQLRVSDAAGRTCIVRDWDGSPLSLDDLPTGIYFAAVHSNLGTIRRKVFVE